MEKQTIGGQNENPVGKNNFSLRLSSVLNEAKKAFDDAVPSSTKEKMFDLRTRPPLWMEICKTLYMIPPAIPVGRDELIKALGDSIGKNDIGYVELDFTLRQMELEGYLKIERGSENYLLTKEAAKVVEVSQSFEEVVVPTMSKMVSAELRNQSVRNPDKYARTIIYEAIK